MSAAAGRERPATNLDNLTLSRKEGWNERVYAPPRTKPDTLTFKQLRQLGETAADAYNVSRSEWHANIRLKTPQLEALHEDLWDILNSNLHDGDKAKGAVAIDGYPGLGKTEAVLALAADFHRREIQRHGAFTRTGDERWPVCRIGMRGNTSMKDFNHALCDFFAHPARCHGSANQLLDRARDLLLSCEVRLLIIDDLHFLHWQHNGGIEISNHFKFIANEFPLTLLSIGVGLGERGVLLEGTTYADAVLAQTTRRTTMLEMRPFAIDTERGRREWQRLMTALQQRLVLARKFPGMLTDELSDYLFNRSTGHIGSLMTLLERGCQRAIRRGTEALTKPLLDTIKIDSAAEQARRELESAYRTRGLRTQRRP
jgi:AAA domain